jgi:hypothetical protein
MNHKKLARIAGYLAILSFAGAFIFSGFHLNFDLFTIHTDVFSDILKTAYSIGYLIFGFGYGSIGLTNGQGARVQYANVTPNIFITVSALGLYNQTATTRNNGANFGIDNDRITYGIQAAINAVPTFDTGGLGAEIKILTGNYPIIQPVYFNQSNTILTITTGALIQLPSGSVYNTNTTPSATRQVGFIIRQLSNSELRGNGTIQVATSPSYFLTVGIQIADGVTHFEYDHIQFQNIPNFAILYSGYWASGSIVGSGTFALINGHDNTSNNCGTNSGSPDGGGMRMSWYGSGVTPNNVVVSNEVHTNSNAFGYDLCGSSSGSVNIVTLDNPNLQVVTQNTPQVECIFFEDPISQLYGYSVKTPHLSGGTYGVLVSNGTSASGSWTDIIWTGGVIEKAAKDGFKFTAGVGTITRWTITALDSKNNGQLTVGSGGVTLSGSGTQNGTISYITFTGGHWTDDQSVKTQSYGLVVSFTGTAPRTIDNVRLRGVNAANNLTASTSYTLTSTGLIFTNHETTSCPGINPVNQIVTNMFNTVTNTIGPGGNASAPVASQAYAVVGAPLYLSVTSNGGAIITVQDGNGNNVNGLTAVSTLVAVRLPLGWTINFGAFGGSAPTISGVYGE